MKRAWSVGVLVESGQGTFITSIFALGTQGEAMAQAVRHAVDSVARPGDLVRVRQAHATEVSADLLSAAVDEMQRVA